MLFYIFIYFSYISDNVSSVILDYCILIIFLNCMLLFYYYIIKFRYLSLELNIKIEDSPFKSRS